MSETRGDAVTVPREVELKLDCAASDLTMLAAHPRLRGVEAVEPDRLVTRYYDTPGRDLRAAGLTLRVRAQGGRFVQTVKAGGDGVGLFDRAEWERTIASETPDPAAWADTAAERILCDAGALPVGLFSSVLTRRLLPVAQGTSCILVTFDEGRIEGPAGDTPLCELELDFRGGDPADLFVLAQALAETVPLRLGVMSKSARGFALIDGSVPRACKAEPIKLSAGASTAEVFRSVARACLRHMRLNEDVVLKLGRDPEALHQMRVALRRLRSALSLFAPVLEADPRAASFADEIKRVTEPFGRARNLDVFLGETLPSLVEARPDDPELDHLRARAESERERAYVAVLAILDSLQWRNLLIDLVGWIETGAWAERAEAGEDARDFAARVLERASRRLKSRGRGLKRLDPESRHRARIAAKKLRYGAEFFGGLYPKKKDRRRRAAFGAALKDLQDHLGTLNDWETARSVADGLAGPSLPGPDAASVADLLHAAAKARTELLDVKPFWR